MRRSVNGRFRAACFAGGITAERGDADAGRGRDDVAAEVAGVGHSADCEGIGLQPHDGAALCVARRLAAVSRQRPSARLGRSGSLAVGTLPSARRQRRCGAPRACRREGDPAEPAHDRARGRAAAAAVGSGNTGDDSLRDAAGQAAGSISASVVYRSAATA